VIKRADTIRLNEVLHVAHGVTTGNTNDVDLIAVLLVCVCDRRRFPLTRRSPGRPEPEHCVLALEAGQVDLASGDRVDHTGQRRRSTCISRCLGGRTAAGSQRHEHRRHRSQESPSPHTTHRTGWGLLDIGSFSRCSQA